MSLFDALPVPAAVASEHDLLLSTFAPGLGCWAECCCGWISNGYLREQTALVAHRRHQSAQIGRAS